MKILVSTIVGILLLNGCGDEKSTGEKMAESVAKIRGENPIADAIIDEPIKKISPDKPTKEEVSDKEQTAQTEEEASISLRDIAHQAVKEMKEVTSPMLDSAKDVASIASKSAKEMIEETQEAVESTLSSAKSTIGEQVSKATKLLQTETNTTK